jgi:hypothetical protein
MSHILLVGAGFSHNWGGMLAADLFDDLLGAPELDTHCKDLLWQHRQGGFEGALAVLQGEGGPSLEHMEKALRGVFSRMNSAFVAQGFTLEFKQGAEADRDDSVKRFLARFDAIFSLNQDLLLESGYCAQADPPQAFNPRWSGYALPGMTPRLQPPAFSLLPRWCGEFCPDPRNVVDLPNPHTQPIYKLHGSSNWVDQSNGRLIIMGGDKTRAINGSAVLKSYAREFERRLNQPNTRLMMIGYGFGDGHITGAIERAAAAGHLKVFIIDPWGSEAPDPMRGRQNVIRIAPPVNAIQANLIGASKLGLAHIFGGNVIERGRVLRFFEP